MSEPAYNPEPDRSSPPMSRRDRTVRPGIGWSVESARERGVCPRCKDGNGTVTDGAGSRTDCYSCRGKGTWDAYKLHREFVKGWNAALDDMRRRQSFAHMDMP